MGSWLETVRAEAADGVNRSLDEIVEALLDSGKADFHDVIPLDYFDDGAGAYCDLSEAAEILDELSDYEETDSGLWSGLPPREAVCAQAGWTCRNAAQCLAEELLKRINKDEEIKTLLKDGREDELDDDRLAGLVRARVEEIIEEWR